MLRLLSTEMYNMVSDSLPMPKISMMHQWKFPMVKPVVEINSTKQLSSYEIFNYNSKSAWVL